MPRKPNHTTIRISKDSALWLKRDYPGMTYEEILELLQLKLSSKGPNNE